MENWQGSQRPGHRVLVDHLKSVLEEQWETLLIGLKQASGMCALI